MTPEKLVPIIVAELRSGVWPKSTKYGIIISDETDACGEWYHPIFLAQMVVEIIILQKRIIRYRMTKAGFPEWDLSSREKDVEAEVLRDFGLTNQDYEWLKGKVGEWGSQL